MVQNLNFKCRSDTESEFKILSKERAKIPNTNLQEKKKLAELDQKIPFYSEIY